MQCWVPFHEEHFHFIWLFFCKYTYILLYIHVYKNLHFCQQTKRFFKNMVEVSGEEWSSETNGAQFKWWSETIQVLPWDKCLKLPTYLPPLMYSILAQLVRKERRIDVFSSWAASHNRCSYFLVSSLVRSGTASPICKFINEFVASNWQIAWYGMKYCDISWSWVALIL